jgi:catechol 2,3-dioxygenase-like lactoylglutathione lyase family enzyme
MPSVNGLLESALYVADVGRSAEFYQRVFGFRRLVSEANFCAFDVAGRQVLLLFERGGSTSPTRLPGGVIPPHDGRGTLHFAFAIAADELETWERWLSSQQVAIESRVDWQGGGVSLYFRDPDSHLVELATPGLWSIY